jgi:hypothetical protein
MSWLFFDLVAIRSKEEHGYNWSCNIYWTFLFVIMIFGFSSHLQINKELQIRSNLKSIMNQLKKKKHLNMDV